MIIWCETGELIDSVTCSLRSFSLVLTVWCELDQQVDLFYSGYFLLRARWWLKYVSCRCSPASFISSLVVSLWSIWTFLSTSCFPVLTQSSKYSPLTYLSNWGSKPLSNQACTDSRLYGYMSILWGFLDFYIRNKMPSFMKHAVIIDNGTGYVTLGLLLKLIKRNGSFDFKKSLIHISISKQKWLMIFPITCLFGVIIKLLTKIFLLLPTKQFDIYSL